MTVLTKRVFNRADVSLSAKEAQRRRAALSQSPAMQSTLHATVPSMQRALFFLPVALFSVYISYTEEPSSISVAETSETSITSYKNLIFPFTGNTSGCLCSKRHVISVILFFSL